MQSHSAQWPQGVNSRGSTNGHAPASMDDVGWNDEDDNFLAYFLSGEQSENHGGQTRISPNIQAFTNEQKDNSMPPPPAVHSRVQVTTVSSSMYDQQQNDKKTVGIEPPATPAIQFYASNTLHQNQPSQPQPQVPQQQQQLTQQTQSTSTTTMQGNQLHHYQHIQSNQPQQQQQHQFSNVFTQPQASTMMANLAPSSSSSSSSLSSMQAASAHVMQVQQQFKAQGVPLPDNFTNMSPISPAAMIGASGEMMLLPMASPMYTNKNQVQSAPSSAPAPGQSQAQPQQDQNNSYQMAHTEWLNHMNQVAASASMGSMVPNMGSLAPVSSTQPNTNQTTSHFQNMITGQVPMQNQGLQQQQVITPMPIPGTLQNTVPNNTDILPSVSSSANNNGIVMTHFQHQPNLGQDTSQDHVTETKEKRERRLARNRESARQSRRRKKELLLNLGNQVNELHTEIETERRGQLTTMESELGKDKKRCIQQMKDESNISKDVLKSQVESVVQNGGPNCPARRTAVVHQYNALRQLILPFYKQYFLWLSLQNESFLTLAKENKSKVSKGTGRISSKQVGEEITTAQKKEAKGGTKASINCDAHDSNKSWPLMCYELGVSLDQEEKLLNTFRRMKTNLKKGQGSLSSRVEASTSTTMVENLKNGVLFQSHSAGHRNEAALLQVLTPEQSARFHVWFDSNKERCMEAFGTNKTMKGACGGTGDNPNEQLGHSDTSSLNDVCRQLTEALKINER